MAILSICPSCQAKLKVPEQMENQKSKCPKCQKMFVITKCDVGNNTEAKPNIKSNEEPTIVPVENKTLPSKPDLNSEVIEPRIQDYEINPRVIQTNVIVNQAVAPTNSLGIASLVVAIMSYFMCWLPGIGLVISGLAVLLGVAGLFMALKRKGTGVGYAIAGLVLASMSLIITFIWSSAVFQTADQLVKANKGANANIAVPEKKVGDAPDVNPNNDLQNDLVNASKEPAVFQGIEVKIKSVNIDYVTGVDIREFTSNEKHLKIVLYISNLNQNKKIDYDGWGRNRLGVGKGTPSLTDNFGNMYKLVNFGLGSRIVGQIKSEALYPNKPISDLIVFEKPLDTLEYLVLDLPAGNLGLREEYNLRFLKK